MTPTTLRKNLFQTLHRVMHGETIIIKTDEGEAVITARKKKDLSPSHYKESGKAKIPGRIVGSLDTADAELREYLSLPY